MLKSPCASMQDESIYILILEWSERGYVCERERMRERERERERERKRERERAQIDSIAPVEYAINGTLHILAPAHGTSILTLSSSPSHSPPSLSLSLSTALCLSLLSSSSPLLQLRMIRKPLKRSRAQHYASGPNIHPCTSFQVKQRRYVDSLMKVCQAFRQLACPMHTSLDNPHISYTDFPLSTPTRSQTLPPLAYKLHLELRFSLTDKIR
jgi:hypothetical protein